MASSPRLRGWELPPSLDPRDALGALSPEFGSTLSKARRSVWTLVDDYDWSLWQAGWLLLVGQEELCLASRQGERVGADLTVPLPPPISPATLPDGSLAEAVRAVTQRPLLSRGRILCSRREIQIRHGGDKRIASGWSEVWRLPNSHQLIEGIWLAPLRGYGKDCKPIRKAMKQCAVRPAKGSLLFAVLESGGVRTFRPDIPDLRMPLRTNGKPHAAVTDRLASLLAASWRNEEGIVQDLDPQCLHHYRVGLRRARVLATHAKRVLGPVTARALASQLRALGQRTGPLRDLDVQLANRSWYESLLAPQDRAGLGSFMDALERQRAQAWRSLRRYLGSKGYRQRQERLEQLLAMPARDDKSVRHLLRRALRQRFHKLARRRESVGDSPVDGELHRLRIEAKKLRYLFEFAGGILPQKQTAKWLPKLRHLQDALGHAHDLAVCLDWVTTRAAGLNHRTRRAEADSLAALAVALQGLLAEHRDAAVRDLRIFVVEDGEPFLALIGNKERKS
jgi:CHAD domain-containing protein